MTIVSVLSSRKNPFKKQFQRELFTAKTLASRAKDKQTSSLSNKETKIRVSENNHNL